MISHQINGLAEDLNRQLPKKKNNKIFGASSFDSSRVDCEKFLFKIEMIHKHENHNTVHFLDYRPAKHIREALI